MAKRVPIRKTARDEAALDGRGSSAPEPPPRTKAAAKAPARSRVRKASVTRKPRAKKAPPQLWASWGVFDNCMRRVATFDYRDRALADEKYTALNQAGPGRFTLLLVKEARAAVESAANLA